ncbi:reverse transcriptase domain-containing protein, partial [Tanacetum coccineum]
VMTAPVIPISSDSSEKSVGSHVLRVILFGTIPTSIPVIPVVPAEVPIVPADPLVAPEVGAVSVISPTRVLDLVDYSSSSDSDPSKDSLPLTLELPLVLPFLCSDDSEADSESEHAEQRPERHESLTDHDVMVSRWRDRPDSTSDSSSFSSSLDYSSDVSSGSSSDSLSDLSSVHSSGCDASGQSHSGPSTRVASPRLVYPSVITPRCSEAFLRWRSAPLSNPYPPMTSESSLDSSSERSLDSSSPSAGPSRKRCKSPTTLVSSSTHAVADLGIGDGVGVHTEDGISMGVEVATSDIREDEEEFEAEASAGGTMEIAVNPLVTGCISESTGGDVTDLEGTLYDIARYMFEVPLDRITEFEISQRYLRHYMALSQEEFCQIRRDRDDARRRLRRLESFITTITRSGMTPKAIEELINQQVAEALTTYEANRATDLVIETVEEMEMEMEEGMEMEITMRMIKVLGLLPLMKLMAQVYCPRTEIQKMEYKLWNLTVKNNNLAAYTQRFQKLTMLCTKIVPEEEDRVEKFIGGLSDNI